MSIAVNAHIYPHRPRKDKKIAGHYIQTGNLFPLGTPDLQQQQFIGIHKCVCITIGRPDTITDLMGIGSDFLFMEEWGDITWIGGVRCYCTPHGFKVYVPSNIWKPSDIAFETHVSLVGSAEEAKGAKGSGHKYYVVSFPLLTRKVIQNDESPYGIPPLQDKESVSG